MIKGLQKLILAAVIGAGITGISGCNNCKSQFYEEQIYSKNKQILQEGIKDMHLIIDVAGSWKIYFKGDYNFNKTVLFPKNMSGKGEIIANITNKENMDLFLSYSGDMDSINAYTETKNAEYLKEFNLLFSLNLKDNKTSKFIVLAKGENATTYTKNNGFWYKNTSKVSDLESYFKIGNIDNKQILGKKIPESCVQKYINLCDKMKSNYFE